jgi:hypothetical protein
MMYSFQQISDKVKPRDVLKPADDLHLWDLLFGLRLVLPSQPEPGRPSLSFLLRLY